MAAISSDDALQRHAVLRRAAPRRSDAVRALRSGEAPALRLAQGDAFNDYLGTSIELKAPGRESWHAWLLLVEQLPVGIEGSPVPRNIVRNVFRPDWHSVVGRDPRLLAETRAMQIHEGAQAQRLRLVALLQDGRGRIRAITQTECRE
jgi:hypothetical protein